LRVSARNIVTVRHSAVAKTVDVHHADGRPLVAGELGAGDEITIDMRTGEILAIWRKKKASEPKG
jgi:hypothetical protein